MSCCKNLCIKLRIVPQPKDSFIEQSVHLFRARRFCADVALGVALLGLVLMVLDMESDFAKRPELANALRWALIGSTVVLLLLTVRYHVLQTKYHMHRNAIRRWQCALRVRQRMQIVLELCVCAVMPLPMPSVTPVLRSADAFLCALMFARVYWLARVMRLHSRLSTDATAKSVAGMNRVKPDTRFFMKRMLFLYPEFVLPTSVGLFWLIGAYIFRICESKNDAGFNYYNTLWLMCVTFLTIGYGDIYPSTLCGRVWAICVGITGIWIATSLIVTVIVQKISLNHSEERVHRFMAKTKHMENLKLTAAQVLKQSWFVHKFRKMGDEDKARYHQYRQRSAYHALRKMQEHFFQDEASIEDVARSVYNSLELIRSQNNAQQKANERFNMLDQRLDHLQDTLATLAQLLAKKDGPIQKKEES